MVASDVEVGDADAEKNDVDVENVNVQDSESKCQDEVNIQGNGDSAANVCTMDTVVGNVTESGNAEGVVAQRDGEKEETDLKHEMRAPFHDKNEASEVKGVNGFNDQLIFNKKEDKGIQMDNRSESSAENLSQRENDVDNEAIEEKSSDGRVKEMDAEKGVGSGRLDVSVEEENSNGETTVEKTGKRDGICIVHVADKELSKDNDVTKDDQEENKDPSKSPSDNRCQNGHSSRSSPGTDNGMENADKVNEYNVVKDEPKEQNKVLDSSDIIDGPNDNLVIVHTKNEDEEDFSVTKPNETSTPNSIIRYPTIAGEHGSQAAKPVYTQATIPLMAEDDNGTPEEQAAFMKEIETFYRSAAIDYKPPKFYGQPLNCLKLWRAVIRLGGYDRVTGSKLWRQVGESFHPPKTCTTVSWTFRIFYEKSLLEYERHKVRNGEVQLPVSFPEASGVYIVGNGYQGSGRAKRDSAARATQGWHAQRLSTNGDVGGPVVKDKSHINIEKREKGEKGMGSLKQKRSNEVDHPVKAARIETPRQLAAQVVDVGPPADWVKINVRETYDCFEVYCLVPGLLREEVRVQSDPAGGLVITGQPEQANNPWGITPFKKVVSLPARIDPLETSAVMSLHGRLFVRVPFDKPKHIVQ